MGFLYQMMDGAKITLLIFLLTIALAIPLGFLVALARLSRLWLLRFLADIYIWIMRGTPLMLQLFFMYFGLPAIPLICKSWGIALPAALEQIFVLGRFQATIFTFVLNYAAYFAEIFRGGIQSIDRGQYEGAKVLGLTNAQTMRRIVLPQVIKRVLPPLTNESITLVKDTSLAQVLAVQELIKITKDMTQAQASLLPYVFAAAFQLVMTLLFTRLFGFV